MATEGKKPSVVVQIEGGIATVILSRPDRMNAFNEAMCNELISAFECVDQVCIDNNSFPVFFYKQKQTKIPSSTPFP